MTTKEVAGRLAELCRKGDFETAQNELFSSDAVSVEQNSTPDFEKETKGLQAIRDKGKKWDDMVETMHEIQVSEPLMVSNSFALTIRMNLTMKGHGQMDMTELCVYEVKDGKIVKEEFLM